MLHYLPEFVRQVSSDATARRSDWVTQGHSASVDIDLAWVKVKGLHDGQCLRGECFVNL
jgi:hypothetical protein